MTLDEHAACWILLPGFQAGELSDADRDRVEAHLPTCPECASQLEEIPPVELPSEPRPRRLARFLSPVTGPRRNPRIVRGFLAAAATFFLGLVGYLIVDIDQAPDASPTGETSDMPVAVASPDLATAAESDRHREGSSGSSGPVAADRAGQVLDEPAIFYPEAIRSDPSESADSEDFHQMKGDSSRFLSYIRGDSGGYRGRASSGAFDTLGVGVGGGSGGRYAAVFGGREAHVARGGGTAATPVFRPMDAVRAFRAEAPQVEQAEGAASPAAKPPPPPAQDETPRMSRKIIRSGIMEFEIDSFDSSVGTLTKIAVEEQGYIATVNSEKLQNGKVHGTVVVRVPPEHLDTLLLKLRALGELKSQRIGSEDVTKTYLDLESRLRAARTMEERLIAIIRDGKGQIKDLLLAEKELGEWRTRIETMVGEITYYNNLIAHSTLTITLAEKEIRSPYGLLETEHVELGIEVEDVEKAYGDALAAIAEAKGRVQRSELKQLGQGQFNAVVQFDVAPPRAGPLRDRLKQLGVLARLDITRVQEAQGGSGRPQDAKIQQNDTQILISLYNLVNVAPRETVQVNLACADTEASYKAVLDRAEKAAGRILSSTLLRQKADQSTGHLLFQIKAADADAVLNDIRAAGEVLKLEVTENSDTANATRTKRGFTVNFFGLGTVQAREASTIVLASKDVAGGYRLLAAAAKAAGARILTATLSENDRKNMTATLTIEIRRENEAAVTEAMAKAGDVYTRNSTRSQDLDNVSDSKLLLQFRFFDSSNIPARESVRLSVEVGDVDSVSKSLEAEYRGRLIDARHTRDAGGHRESTLTIDVPLKDAAAAAERIKSLGTVLEHVASKNAGVPDNELALARLELKISNDVLVGRDSGPLANVKRGLAISLQAGSWALMLIMIGVCFVCPLLLVVWAGLRLRRRLGAKPAPVPTPTA